MIRDPILKLALSMHSNPGVYALLLGSGSSRSAGIPTGWEIVLDLINKIVTVEGEDPQPDPTKWYLEKFGEIPKYDTLLDRLTTTPTERMALLRSYFEPSEEEREEGLKSPTDAHRSIATLVKLGYIRIILTTNFDRLMETALELEGITPDVIRSEDTLKGSLPYVHSNCVVIKLHGDYRDTRIKNTPDELAHYSSNLNKLLDRILDEFGIIICGWSGAWDVALRNAILRCSSRRFTTFWLAKDELLEEAKELVNHRRAEVIKIESANSLFIQLKEKIYSLRELEISHPVSRAVAVATTKRYLSEPRFRIRLHDLVLEEVERIHGELASEIFITRDQVAVQETFQQRMHLYEAIIDQLTAMLMAIGFHDEGRNAYLLTTSIERLVQPPRHEGSTLFLGLQQYPAMLLTYATGVVALAAKKYPNLKAILIEPRFIDKFSREKSPALIKFRPSVVFQKAQNWVPGAREREYTPVNNHIFGLLKLYVQDYLPDDIIYEEYFDLFEFILSLTYLDLFPSVRPPIGRFGWRYRDPGSNELLKNSPINEFINIGLEKENDWELLKAGFFGGSSDRFREILSRYVEFLQSIAKTWY